MMRELVTAPCIMAFTCDEETICSIMDEMVRYLILQQSFKTTMANCSQLLGRGHAHRRAVRTRLEVMLNSAEFTLRYRMALLKFAAGDIKAADSFGVDVAEIIVMHERNQKYLKRALSKMAHHKDVIGPRHAENLWLGVMRRTKPHASKFAYRRAKFLTMGNNGLQHSDCVADILMMGMRSFRWYYPFKSGTYMDCSVRTAMTNRGLSYIKKATRQCRVRLVTGEDGVVFNMEGSDDIAMSNYSDNPGVERDANLRLDIESLMHRKDAVGKFSRFIVNDEYHERFINWVQAHYHVGNHEDIPSIAKALGNQYVPILSKFMMLDASDLRRAISIVKRKVA
jgi:DNA-directed RNA polymerase specialized sigma24 family protein